MRRPCIVASCRNYTENGSRCPQHAIPAYPHHERERMRAAVAQHVLDHGYWCPGWGVRPHPSQDLTADHIIARAHGGLYGPLTVLCRACNGRKSSS